VVIHTLQRYKEHMILKSYQTIVLAPNYLVLAENGRRFSEMCCLNHQGRREIWLGESRRLLPLQFTMPLLTFILLTWRIW